MPNPGGINQLGSDRVPYGDAKRLKTLTAEAPMSGAPLASPALNQPRTAQDSAGQQPVQQSAPAAPAVPQVSPQAFAAQAWQQIAAIPGASPLVQEYASQAQNG